MPSFAELADRVTRHIESRYGIRVVVYDVPDPATGDLDGCEIHVDWLVSDELRLFLLVHLFGHTVQWNTSPRAFELGRPLDPPVAEALLPELREYEREAAGFGASLLAETGVDGMDQWLADFTESDLTYLMHYYRTGEKRPFREFWRSGCARIPAREIPAFTPTRRVFRRDGIVI